MIRNLILFLSASLPLCVAGFTGCSEDCSDVLCEPSPPVLTVTVTDTIEVGDTIIRLPVNDATVTLLVDAGAQLVDPLEVPPNVFDSTYVLPEGQQPGAELFGIIAEREGRRDTLRNLPLQRVEGCCPQVLIGWFRIDL